MKTAAKRKPGRKATGLRDLPPEAARLVVAGASLRAVREALALREGAVKATGMSGGLPTLERLLRGDVVAGRVPVAEDGEVELRPVLRSRTLGEQLVVDGFGELAAWTAERFVRDVEASTIGRLTASYGEGCGGATAGEPERLAVAVDRLARAQQGLTRRERTAVWAVLVFGLSMTDTGWAVAGGKFGHRLPALRDAAWLTLDAALERMAVHYQAIGDA